MSSHPALRVYIEDIPQIGYVYYAPNLTEKEFIVLLWSTVWAVNVYSKWCQTSYV